MEGLPEDLRRWLAENPERAAAELSFLLRYDASMRRILFKARRGEALTDDEYARLMERVSFEDQRRAMGISDEAYRISLLLRSGELQLLVNVAMRTPEALRAPPPPPPPPPPAAGLPKRVVPERRFSARWRSWWPMRTSLFIREFMLRQGGKAHPYEVYDAFRRRLRRSIMADGVSLATGAPEYHVPEFKNFCRYFAVLEDLGLIRRVNGKVPSEKSIFPLQYYEIVPERRDSTMWEAPQKYLYPLADFGKRRYLKLKDELEREIRKREVDIREEASETLGVPPETLTNEQLRRWLVAKEHPTLIENAARALGVPPEDVRRNFVISGKTLP